MSARVSVILPVFNGGGVLRRSVSAVLDQSFTDFELIICDDGSTDNSLSQAEDFARTDERVHVIPLGHAGVSAARNAGLCAAEGDFVAFVDADDKPYEGWLEALVAGIDGADMSLVGYEVYLEEGSSSYDTSHLGEDWLSFDTDTFMRALFSNELMYQGYVWNKLFRRSVIEDGVPLRFNTSIALNEDRLFVFDYIHRVGRVSYLPRVLYHYNQHTPRSDYQQVMATEIDATEHMIKELESATPRNIEALFYARKDLFRAAVELYEKADSAQHPDALRYADITKELHTYAKEFTNYPPAFQQQISRVSGGL